MSEKTISEQMAGEMNSREKFTDSSLSQSEKNDMLAEITVGKEEDLDLFFSGFFEFVGAGTVSDLSLEKQIEAFKNSKARASNYESIEQVYAYVMKELGAPVVAEAKTASSEQASPDDISMSADKSSAPSMAAPASTNASPNEGGSGKQAIEGNLDKNSAKIDEDLRASASADRGMGGPQRANMSHGGGGGDGSGVLGGLVNALAMSPVNLARGIYGFAKEVVVDSQGVSAVAAGALMAGAKKGAGAVGAVKDKIDLNTFASRSSQVDASMEAMRNAAQSLKQLLPGAPAHEQMIATDKFIKAKNSVVDHLDSEFKSGLKQVKKRNKTPGDLADFMESRKEQMLAICDDVLDSDGAKSNPETSSKIKDEKEKLAEQLREMAEKIINMIKKFFKAKAPSPSPN